MATNVSYQNPNRRDENTPLVVILETRLDTKQSTAMDARNAKYVIDLTRASFGGIVYPKPGTQWFIKRISGVWVLMARAPQQSPQLKTTFTPAIGETYIGNEGTTHIVGDLKVEGTLTVAGSGSDPELGTIKLNTVAAAPTNWMNCDGSPISRTTYATLFALIGTTYGTGDGSTTFNIPDMRERTAVGFKSGSAEFGALNQSGGEKTHVLLLAELAAHTHTVSAITVGNQSVDHTHSGSSLTTGTESATHTHTIGADNDTASGSFGYSVHRGAGSGAVQSNVSTTESATHTHAISGSTGGASAVHNHALSGNTDSTGSGTAHNNIQPYLTLNYIIKVLPSGGVGGGGGGSDVDSLAGLSDVTLTSPVATQILSYNGTKWVNSAAPSGALSGLTDVTIASATNRNILEYNGTVWVNRPDIDLAVASSTTSAVAARVTGDSQARFYFDAAGKHYWGTGAGATDTDLYRNGVNALATDGSFTSLGNLYSFQGVNAAGSGGVTVQAFGAAQPVIKLNSGATGITFSDGTNATDTNLYRLSAGVLETTSAISSKRTTASTDVALQSYVTGDTVNRFQMTADGKHNWGPGGSTALDTNLYRLSAGVLKTDSGLTVVGAFTVGTVQIDPSGPSTSNVLRYNGTKYVSAALAESDITNLTTDLAGKQPLSTITTKGDLYVGTASATTARFGVGTDGQVIVADSTQTVGMKWTTSPGGTPVATRMISNATQSITTATPTAVSFTSTIFDTNASWSNSNPTRFTAKIAGYYVCVANITWPGGNTGTQRLLIWAVNGTQQSGSESVLPPNANSMVQTSAVFEVFLNVNDYVEIQAQQDSGGSISIGSASANTYNSMSVSLIGSSTSMTGPTIRAGTIAQFAGSTAPNGWVFCDGTSYLRTTYPDLFNAIGTTYGSVDGTHFTVPNFNGRVALGVGDSGTAGHTSHALGSTGGEERHTLTVQELPDHGHGAPAGLGAGSNTADVVARGTGPDNNFRLQDLHLYTSTTYGSTAVSGSRDHNLLPSYLTVNFIIKTSDTADIVNGSVTNAKLAWDIFTTKGDIVAATGASAASRLAVGTNNQVLTADSTQATGLKYASPYPNTAFASSTSISLASSSATYVNLGLSATITKNFTNSKLVCHVTGGYWWNGNTAVDVAVQIAGTDYQLHHFTQTTSANTRFAFSGFVEVSGIAAGSQTVQVRVHSNGTLTINWDSGHYYALHITEVGG